MPSRRRFLQSLGAATVAAPFFKPGVRAAAPSAALRHASIGGGGMALVDARALAGNPQVRLVAFAEVDLGRAGEMRELFPDARVYQDWRQLLDREHAHLDSVNVSVPDHMHAPIALAAMQLGKHCYCQKPLAHDLHEARVLANFARERRVVTQMGIQNHSLKGYRQAVALVRGGAIGKVREVHCWTSKQWGDRGPAPARPGAVPGDFDWDLWLGTATARPFTAGHYHPGVWRRRLDFGTGTLGDMGCHILDPVFQALALSAPQSVRSEGPVPDAWNWPVESIVRFVFPGTPHTADKTVAITWYDGRARPAPEVRALIPPSPSRRPDGELLPDAVDQGSLLIGTAGTMFLPQPGVPKFYPAEKFRDLPLPDVENGDHWSLWADACLQGGRPSANFDYSGPLTEMILLGCVALRFRHTTLQWDAPRLRFTNETAANRFLRRTYRPGWQFSGL